MSMYTRVTKTRIASQRGELIIDLGKAHPAPALKEVDRLSITMKCEDGKTRSIHMYGEEVEQLRKTLSR